MLEAYTANPPQDATHRLLDLFLSDVAAVKGVVGVRTLLKLYTSIDAVKLSAFLGDGSDDEEKVLEQLMVLKAASRTYARGSASAGESSTSASSSMLDGDRIVTNNLDFTIDGVS